MAAVFATLLLQDGCDLSVTSDLLEIRLTCGQINLFETIGLVVLSKVPCHVCVSNRT